MKALIAFGLFCTAGFIVGGCGGSHTNDHVPNLYAANWTGTWVGPVANDGGLLTLKIDVFGNLTGTMGRNGGLSGTVGGAVTGTGKFSATSTFPTSGNFVMNGQMVESSSGSLTGNFTYWWNGTLYTGNFTATDAAAATTG